MAQSVKPVAPNTPTLLPGQGDGVGGGLRRNGGVEAGVEAGDLGHVRPQFPQGSDGGQAPRIMQGRQVGQHPERFVHGVIENDGLREHRAAVHDPMPGGIDLRTRLEEGPEFAAHFVRGHARKILGRHHMIGAVQKAQLQTARTGIDHQDLHVPTLPDRVRPTGRLATTDPLTRSRRGR